MERTAMLDGIDFAKMVRAGAVNLRAHAQEINDLNVFPIPDGDTGDNMLLTILGGAETAGNGSKSLSETSRRVADGMLLGARGNSGVILSQFFDGIAAGLENTEEADTARFAEALQCGVRHAYRAVVEPTEGTILTVARCGTEAACNAESETPVQLLKCFITEARLTLERTPDLLPVLKKAGVVDSGGEGLIRIMEGMLSSLTGDVESVSLPEERGTENGMDISLFTEDSVLEFGYCTELLLRLQRAKTDPETFDVSVITDDLKTIGDSVVAFKTGSIVKLHVHTMTPDKVLALCQRYGEFLKVKIENMSLQHNNSVLKETDKTAEKKKERKKYGFAAVCSGDGLKEMFTERGADVVVDGGQSRNPSAEDFLQAFDEVNADTVFVFPNNGNILLTAKQAAGMAKDTDVRVIGSRNIGEGYAALSMYDSEMDDADEITNALNEAMQGVVTLEVSRSIRDTEDTHAGDYIGFVGKEILFSDADRNKAVCGALDRIDRGSWDICILIRGRDADENEAAAIEKYIASQYRGKEVYTAFGGQEIYDYILILE